MKKQTTEAAAVDAVIATVPKSIDVTHTPDKLLAIAIEKGVDVDKLEKLMELQERWMAGIRERAFKAAHREFQREAPAILKTRDGAKLRSKDDTNAPTKASYKFADIAVIAELLKESLYKHGLSYRWTFRNFIDEKKVDKIEVTCIVSHIDGHEEHTSLSDTREDSGGKNHLQAGGSTLTYLERYTLIGALGLTTLLKDDDGKGAGAPAAKVIPKEQNNGPKQPMTDVQFMTALERIRNGEDLQQQIRDHYTLTDKQSVALEAITSGSPIATGKAKGKRQKAQQA